MITDDDEWNNSGFIKSVEDEELFEDLIELPMYIRNEYTSIIEERNRRTLQ